MTVLSQPTRQSPKRLRLALFASLFGIYLLTSSGHNYAIDEELMFEVTENLWLHGDFALNAGSEQEPPQYSQYGPGQSIAALPLYGIGRALATFFPSEAYAFLTRALVGWFNPIITAGIATLLYGATCLLGYGHRVAVGTALLYALGTMAWPHSKTFFAEPLTALLLFSSFVILLRLDRTVEKQPKRLLWFALSGLLTGLAPIVKVQVAVALPVLAIYAALLTLMPSSCRGRAAGIKELGVWGLSAAVGVGLLALYQFVLFGSVLRTGYGNSVWSDFNAPFWEGFNGQIWSSGRGLVWYAPPFLLLPFGLWLLRRRDWKVALVCLMMAASHVLLYAKWVAWDGAGAWGPRFLNAVLPFMGVPLAAYLHSLRGWQTRTRTAALAVVLLLTVPVQLAGLTINMNAFFSATRSIETSYYRVADSAIVGHLRFAAQQIRDAYNLHVAPNSIVLLDGFAYSEGRPAQVPRWTLPHATIKVRTSATTALSLDMDSCAAQPSPTPFRLRVENAPLLVDAQPCPGRSYHVLVPPGSSALHIEATEWNPADFGIERDGPLGVLVQGISGEAQGQALVVQGRLVPIPSMPAGQSSLRRWTTDHRFGHWDFWWWYLVHSGLPMRSVVLLTGIWVGLGLGAFVWGISQRFWIADKQ